MQARKRDLESFGTQKENIRLGTTYFPVKLFINSRSEDSIVLPHWHDFVEVLCVISGNASILINAKEINAGPGDVVLINTSDVHSIGESNSVYYGVQMDPDIFYSIGVNLIKWFPQQLDLKHLSADNTIAKEIYAAVKRIFERRHETGKHDEVFLFSKTMEIMSLIMKYTSEHEIDEVLLYKDLYDKSRLESIREYIEKNYQEQIPISDISSHLHLTENYFCRFFKQATGKTFSQYLKLFRCQKAEKLMQETSKTITQIAFEVGFRNATYFSKEYKDVRGVSPSENRKNFALRLTDRNSKELLRN